MTSRYEGSQNLLWHMDEACFFLSLLSVAEEERERRGMAPVKIDLLDAVRECRKAGLVKEDFTVLDDLAVLRLLTGCAVSKEVRDHCYALRGCQYSIEKWLSRDGERNHFRRRYFDVYTGSRTVAEGTRMCFYIYEFKE